MARTSNIFARPRALDSVDVTDAPNSGAPLYQGYEDAYATGVKANMTDVRFSGQMGYSNNFTYWVNAQPYVSRNLVPILLEAPLGFRALPNSSIYIGALRSLVEDCALSITGLNAELSVSIGSKVFGGAGQEIEVFTNVKEARSNVQFSWYDYPGLPVYNIMSTWIRMLMMDPNTKFATINTIPSHELADLMADQYSMSMMFIEPDPLHRLVVNAWLVTNMFPHGTGALTGKRDMANDMELREVSIEFGGLTMFGAGINDVAQYLLKQINIHGADPHARAACVEEVSKHIKDKIGDSYQRSAERLADINRINHPKITDA